ELGRHEEGFADRSRAIELAPRMAKAWAARGAAHYLRGEYDDAVSDLQQARRLDPADQEAQRILDLAQAGVNERIRKARAVEQARETTRVTLPAPEQPVAVTPPAPAEPPPAE